ncbi:hypothetical protein, partial [Neisseria montereyensis]
VPATVPAAKKPNYTDSKTSSQYPITQKYPTYHHYFVYLENFFKRYFIFIQHSAITTLFFSYIKPADQYIF